MYYLYKVEGSLRDSKIKTALFVSVNLTQAMLCRSNAVKEA